MTAAELRLYFLAWCESRAEVDRLAAMEPSPAVDLDYKKAVAAELRERKRYLHARYYEQIALSTGEK